jgi:hypothetical protein
MELAEPARSPSFIASRVSGRTKHIADAVVVEEQDNSAHEPASAHAADARRAMLLVVR